MIDIIKDVENIYNDFGNTLVNLEKPFGLSTEHTPVLGSCNKNKDIYRVVTPITGNDNLDLLVKLHEYGHIKCGHLEGIHEDMDSNLRKIIMNKDEMLINAINEKCSIDYASDILDRVLNDPTLNHVIHNMAMDMEVNSSILDENDIHIITEGMNQLIYEEYMKISEDGTKQVSMREMNNLFAKFDMKLIHPSTFGFESGLTYPDYLVQCILNLDKVLNELSNNYNDDNKAKDRLDQQDQKNQNQQSGQGDCDRNNEQSDSNQEQDGGGSGQSGDQNESDSSSSSSNSSDSQGQNQQSQSQGGSGNSSEDQSESQDPKDNPNMPKTREEFDQMMENMKNSNSQGQQNSSQNGDSNDDQMPSMKSGSNGGNQSQSQQNDYSNDHGTDSRDQADDKRQNNPNDYAKPSPGIGSEHSDTVRNYKINNDPLEMHLQEIIREYRHKVIKRDFAKDMVHKYNRKILGRDNKMLSPTYRQKITKSENPTIAFVIDVSGSMDESLIDRCITTIRNQMKRLDRSLKYNIIAWDTQLCEYYKNIDFRSPIPRLHSYGGTYLAGAFDLFKKDFGKEAIMILISDFEDHLDSWHRKEVDMNGYSMYGLCYGSRPRNMPNFKNFKVRYCDSSSRDSSW